MDSAPCRRRNGGTLVRRPGRSTPDGGGEPLPAVFRKLDDAGIRLRRGQVALLAAEPNSGKSMVALYWVTRLAEKHKTRVLYISADTDQHDTEVRLGCILSGESYVKVDKWRTEQDYPWEVIQEYMEKVATMAFCFETDPTYDYLAEEVMAFHEIWGEYPEVIVVDNIGNVIPETDNEWLGLKQITRALKRLGRQTGAAVLALHHSNEGSGDPAYPPKRSAIAGKISQYPEMVLTLSMDDSAGILRVASVKNRSGSKDAKGGRWIELFVNPSKMAIAESLQWLRDGYYA